MSFADRELRLGDMAGEYRIVSHLGSGAYGDVFAAVQPVIGKNVAIKVLRPEFSEVKSIVSRFISEARAVNQIAHRNIVDIFSFGTLDDGRLFLVMELLRGKELEVLLAETGPMPAEEALALLTDVAAALDAAHATGVIHRDVKPENVFICLEEDGSRRPKLLDFGVAKLLTTTTDHKTATGIPIGTPLYMSPEQCRGTKDIDHRSDIYSLGVVAYRMLTGGLPFDSDDVMDLLIQHTSEIPRPMSAVLAQIPPAADAAVQHMLAKKPADRPPSAGAAIAALVQAFEGQPQPGVDALPTHVDGSREHHPMASFPTSALLTADFLALGGAIEEAPSLPDSPALVYPDVPSTVSDGGVRTLASADDGVATRDGIHARRAVAVVDVAPDVTRASPGASLGVPITVDGGAAATPALPATLGVPITVDGGAAATPASPAAPRGVPITVDGATERGGSWHGDPRDSHAALGELAQPIARTLSERGGSDALPGHNVGGSRRWAALVGGVLAVALVVLGAFWWSSRHVVETDEDDGAEPDEPDDGSPSAPGDATLPTPGAVVDQTLRRTRVVTSTGPVTNDAEAFGRRVTVLAMDDAGIKSLLVTFDSMQTTAGTSAIALHQVYGVERKTSLLVTKPGDAPLDAAEGAAVGRAVDDLFDPGAFGLFPPREALSSNDEIQLSPAVVHALAAVDRSYRGVNGTAVYRGRSKTGMRFDVALELVSKSQTLSMKGEVVSSGPGGWVLRRELAGVVTDNGETSSMIVRSTSQGVALEASVGLRQRSSGRCVTVADASRRSLALVVTEACERGATHQRFRRIPVSGGRFLLMAEHSGMCLDIEAGSLAPLAPLIQHPCHGQENQQFFATSPADGRALRVAQSGLCLDEGGASGREIIQQGCTKDVAQAFSFE